MRDLSSVARRVSHNLSIVYVGLPVFHHIRRFHFDKGRRWNVVEHLVLQALASSARTAGQLSVDGKLPRRVILEILIRLMRAGWVELRADAKEVTFYCTPRGAAVAYQDQLPAISGAESTKAKLRRRHADRLGISPTRCHTAAVRRLGLRALKVSQSITISISQRHSAVRPGAPRHARFTFPTKTSSLSASTQAIGRLPRGLLYLAFGMASSSIFHQMPPLICERS